MARSALAHAALMIALAASATLAPRAAWAHGEGGAEEGVPDEDEAPALEPRPAPPPRPPVAELPKVVPFDGQPIPEEYSVKMARAPKNLLLFGIVAVNVAQVLAVTVAVVNGGQRSCAHCDQAGFALIPVAGAFIAAGLEKKDALAGLYAISGGFQAVGLALLFAGGTVMRKDLVLRKEVSRDEKSALRVTPFLSPAGAGLSGRF